MQKNNTKAWIHAIRLRTLPLAISSIGMGSFLAASHGEFKISIFLLCIVTTVFLQILSNLANDYGDSVHGADNFARVGPKRSVQTGSINRRSMRTAMFIFAVLSFVSGITLLYLAISFSSLGTFGFFLMMGIIAIIAAIKYTAGKNPYGYSGFGDVSVFLFFGLIGVMGSYYMHVQSVDYKILLPAAACGFFSVAVLNINNIRDIDSDRMAGKRSIPVRIGARRAKIYHWCLILGGLGCAISFVLSRYTNPWEFLFLICLPMFFLNGIRVSSIEDSAKLDPYLKQMALTNLLFVVTFGVGQLAF